MHNLLLWKGSETLRSCPYERSVTGRVSLGGMLGLHRVLIMGCYADSSLFAPEMTRKHC